MMASLIFHLIGYHWNEKMELHWDLEIELKMYFNYDLMKELIWVLQLAPLKDIMIASLIVHLFESHWDKKMELYWDLQIEL